MKTIHNETDLFNYLRLYHFPDLVIKINFLVGTVILRCGDIELNSNVERDITKLYL